MKRCNIFYKVYQYYYFFCGFLTFLYIKDFKYKNNKIVYIMIKKEKKEEEENDKIEEKETSSDEEKESKERKERKTDKEKSEKKIKNEVNYFLGKMNFTIDEVIIIGDEFNPNGIIFKNTKYEFIFTFEFALIGKGLKKDSIGNWNIIEKCTFKFGV